MPISLSISNASKLSTNQLELQRDEDFIPFHDFPELSPTPRVAHQSAAYFKLGEWTPSPPQDHHTNTKAEARGGPSFLGSGG